MLTKPLPRDHAKRPPNAPVDLERLYRLLATPSQAHALKEDEIELDRFDPSAAPLIIKLNEAHAESPEALHAPESDSKTQDYSRAHESSQDSAQGSAQERSQEEGESYLAFLDQVQSRAQTQGKIGDETRAKGGRQRKRRPKPAQGGARGAESHKAEAPGAETSGRATKRRRRRRAPKT